MAVERLAVTPFEQQQPVFGGFEALRRVRGHGLLQVVLQPFRQVGAIARGIDRLAKARALESFDLAIGVMPGQQVV
ncbi:hypothetical protein D3C79_976340 [compost metagenome]